MAASSGSPERSSDRSQFLAWARDDDPERFDLEQTRPGAEGGRAIAHGPGSAGREGLPSARRQGTRQSSGPGRTENRSQVRRTALYWPNFGARTGAVPVECPIIASDDREPLFCTDAFSAYAPRKDFADPAGVFKPRRNIVWRLHDAMGRRDGLQRGVAHLPIGQL